MLKSFTDKFDKDKVIDVVKNKKFWLVLLLVIVFISAAIYVYNNYVKPRMDETYVANKEFVNKDNSNSNSKSGGNGKTVDLYFFYTTWCPYCKSARPIWDQLKQNTEKVNGYKIIYNEVDCEEDTETAQKFKVKGYPTIKLSHNNKVIEYDAKPDVDTLNQFLSQSLT